jgi:tetratricopeptide (TPR) repeat protein
MNRSTALTRAAIVAAITFAATFTVLVVAQGDDEHGVAKAPRADVASQVAFASAQLQRVRETGDPAGYGRAEAALDRALRLKPEDPAALTERGVLRLARHEFRAALADARAARRAAPEANRPFGVLVDALVELGRYDEAERAAQQMVDRKPNLDSYTRVSYLRELRGDLDGAEEALRLAVSAGGATPENTAFAQSLLGELALVRGRPAKAIREFRAATRLVPGHDPSMFGIARAVASQGRLDQAIRLLRAVVRKYPEPDHTTALAEAELAAGRRADAQRHLALFPAQEKALVRKTGARADDHVVLYEIDHGSLQRGLAIARRFHRDNPGPRSADALGWALTRSGRPREGLRVMQRSLAVGSRDPFLTYHAGVAAARVGDRALARRLLRRVVDQAPGFSPLHGPRAARELERLS